MLDRASSRGPTTPRSIYRAPALALAVLFVAGEAAQIRSPIGAYVLSATLLLLAIVVTRRGKTLLATSFLLVAFFLLGSIAFGRARSVVEHQPLLELYESLGKVSFQSPCLVEGRLVREPEQRVDSSVLLLSVEHLVIGRRHWPSSGGLRASVRGSWRFRTQLGALQTGDRVKVWSLLRKPRGFLNPGGFDVSAYLGRAGWTLTGSVKSALLVELVEPAPWWRTLGSRVRGLVRRRVQSAFRHRLGPNDETPGVLIALLVGDRSLIPSWAEDLYQRAGTFHVIAISGAHVGLLAWFLHGGLRRMGLDERPALYILLWVLPFYALLCGGRPSVVRAVLMCLGVVGAKLLSLDSPGMNGLALSGLVLLAMRPMDLEDPGFQLSFVATFSILAFTGTLSHKLAPWLGRAGPLVAVSLAAQAGVVPILAWHFQRLTPAAIAANLLAMPLAFGLILSGAVLVLLAPVPWIGSGVATLALFLVKALTLTSQVAAALPGGSLRVPTPSAAWMCLYLLSLSVAVLSHGWWRKSMVLFLCVLTSWLVVRPNRPTSASHMSLTAFDVGHGDALLLELPGGERLLVDGGGAYNPSFDIGENVLVPALLHRGVRELDAVILTHPDFDHLGGLLAVVSNLRVKEIWEAQSAWLQKSYQVLRARAQARGVEVRRLSTDEVLFLGEVRIEVLSAGDLERPGAPRVSSSNERSLVLRFNYGEASLLLTGDAGEKTERTLLRAGKVLAADVLKVGHHGSRSSTIPAFLEAVSPRVAVVSTRSSGPFRLPSLRVIQRLKARGVTVLRTDRDGAVTVKLDRYGGIQVETYNSTVFR